MEDKLTRRKFIRDSAVAGAAIGAGIGLSNSAGAADSDKILSYNSNMEYRRCGRTGLMISAICLGGHWKRLVKIIGGSEPEGWMTTDIDGDKFRKNRHEVVTRCIERGINYVDACCKEEILAYAKALKGRRDKM
ncbi:MAG: twin-arginine translocation signal domain-containing protein, partial [Planctomycetota bacterium]